MSLRRIVKAFRHPCLAWQWLNSYDYASPNLIPLPRVIETYFPHNVKQKTANARVPHTCRRDHRFPVVGLLTWDEATILYNYGLKFKDKPFLEIGCWVGWSTVAVAMG